MNLIATVIILIGLFFQTAFDAAFPMLSVVPPLFFVVISGIYWLNSNKTEWTTTVIIIVAGLLYDVLRVSTFGQTSIIIIVSLLSSQVLARRVSRNPRIQGYIFALLSLIVFGILDYLAIQYVHVT